MAVARERREDRGVARAVILPIAGPVDPDEWPDFRVAVRQAFDDATRLSNWAIRELAKADSAPAAEGRIPPMPRVYLYGLAREQGMALGEPTSRNALLRMAEQKYRAHRWETRHLGTMSLPSFRWPTPVLFPAKNWTPTIDAAGGHALASVRLAGRRWTLRLRDPGRAKRQLDRFRQLADGTLKYGEAALYAVAAHRGDRRNGMTMREPGGGRRGEVRLMFKAVVWLPRRAAAPGGTLYVRTDPDSFWVYHFGHENEPPRYLHADHVRRWVAEHRRRTHRLADDLKFEKRWPAEVRRRMVESNEARIRKQRNRIHKFCDEASAMIAGFAERRRVSAVVYDDACASYVESFPWAGVRGLLAAKLEERGIAFEHAPRPREGAGD